MASSTILIGLSKTFFYSLNTIQCLCCGPGGYLVAILSLFNNQFLLSLWLLEEEGMNCLIEYPIEVKNSSPSSTSSFSPSVITWHPSGNYLYVIINGVISLFQLKISNQENQEEVSLIEFISRSNERIEGNHEIKYTIKLLFKQKYEEIEIISILSIKEGDFCLLGCKKPSTLIYSSWNFDTIYYFSSNLSTFSLSILSSINVSFFHGQETLSEMDSTLHGQDINTTQPSSSFFYLTQPINKYGYLFGYTSDYSLFCLKYSPTTSLPLVQISSILQPIITINSKLTQFKMSLLNRCHMVS